VWFIHITKLFIYSFGTKDIEMKRYPKDIRCGWEGLSKIVILKFIFTHVSPFYNNFSQILTFVTFDH